MSTDNSEQFKLSPTKVMALFAVAIVLLSFIAYGGSLDNRFTNWDDNWLITENSVIQDPSSENLWHILNPSAPREELGNEYLPTRDLSYVLNHKLSGLTSFGYHFLDLLLHIAVSLLVMLLAWRLTKQHWLAGLAGLLFAVHPVHVEAVAWASSRKDMLSTFFLMISVHLYLCARSNRPEKPTWRNKLQGTKLAIGLAAASFVLALTSKMTAVVLPALLLGIERCFGNQLAKSDTKTRALKQAPFWGLSLVFTLLAMSIGAGLMREPYGEGKFQSLLTATSAITRDFQVLITGQPMLAGVDMPVQTGFSFSVLIGLLILLALIGLAIWGVKQARKEGGGAMPSLLAFCSVWFLASLAPVSNILVQIGTVFAERYLYIPSIGFCIALAAGLTWLARRKPKVTIPVVALTSAAFVALCTVFTVGAAANWANSETLWQHTIDEDAGNHIAYFNLGREYHKRAQTENNKEKRNKLLAYAFANYEQALANPARTYRNDPARVYGQMSLVEVTRSNPEQALEYIIQAFTHVDQPWRNERAKNDIVSLLETPHGMALSALGRHDEAVKAFRRSIEASDAIGRPSGSRINLAQELARNSLGARKVIESELKEAYEQLDAYDESRGEATLISLQARARIRMKEFDTRLEQSGKGGEREIPANLKPILEDARDIYRQIIKHHIPHNMLARVESNIYLEAADAMARGSAGDKTAEKYLMKSLELNIKRAGTRYLLSQLFFERADVTKNPFDKAKARGKANSYLIEELQLHPDYDPAIKLQAVGFRQKAVDEAARLRADNIQNYKSKMNTEDDPTWQGLIVALYSRPAFRNSLLAIVALLRDSTEKDPSSKEGHALMDGLGIQLALGMWFSRDDTMRVNSEELLRTAFNANPLDDGDRPNPVAHVLTKFYLELAEKLVYEPDSKISDKQRRKDMNNLLVNMLSLSDAARKILSKKLFRQAQNISEGPYEVTEPDGRKRELTEGSRNIMASELMRAAIALDAENIPALDWLKNYFEDEGNLAEAISTFELLVSALSDRPELMHGVHLSLAQLQLDLGEQMLRSFKHKLKMHDMTAATEMRTKAVIAYQNCLLTTDNIFSGSKSGENLSMTVRLRGAAAQRLAYLDTSRAPYYYDIAIVGYERVPADFQEDMAEVRRKRSWFFTDPYEKLLQLQELIRDAPASMDTGGVEDDIRALKARIGALEAEQFLDEGDAEKALKRISKVMNAPTPQLFAIRGDIYLAMSDKDPAKFKVLAAKDLAKAVTNPESLLKAANLYWKDRYLMFEGNRYLQARRSFESAHEIVEVAIPHHKPESPERLKLESLRKEASDGMKEMSGMSAHRTTSAARELLRGNLTEALRQVSDALKMNGQSLDAWKVKSRVYRAMAKELTVEGDVDASTGAMEEAKLCLVSGIRLDPPLKSQQLSLLLELGELLVEMRDRNGARTRLDAARLVYSDALEPVKNIYKKRLDALAQSLK